MCPSDIFKSEIIDKKKEEDICNYETIKYIPYASNEENKIIVQGKEII